MEIHKDRNETIDVIKGSLVFLVVWGHAIQFGFGFEYGENYYCLDDEFYRLIYSFHMPLFMAISGFLFHYSLGKGFIHIIKNKLSGILVPYLCYCTFLAIISLSLWKDNYLYLLNIYANGFWFLTSVLLNMFIVGVISCAIKLKLLRDIILFIVLLSVLLIPEDYLYNTHAYVMSAFVFGYWANEYKLSFTVKRWMLIPAIIFLAITPLLFEKEYFVYTSGVSITDWGGQFSVSQLKIDVIRWIFAFVNSICFMVLIVFVRWPLNIKLMLSRLSKYSIGIYCLSFLMQTIIYKLNYHLFNINIPHNYITPIIYGVVITVLCERILHFMKNYKLARLLFLGGR